MIYHPYNKYG